MALSPTIPTSFVPKQPVSPGNRPRSSGVNYFVVGGLVIGGGAILIALGVFLYTVYLGSIITAKKAALDDARKDIAQNRVTEFIKLQHRLTASKTILTQHIALSQFFSLLESITLENVSFTDLDIKVADDRTATLSLSGTAKNFNALAAESTAFAGSKVIKSAIFSGITVNNNGTVQFTISAALDPSIVVQKAGSGTAPAIMTASATTTTPVIPTTPVVKTASSSTTAAPATAPAATMATTTPKVVPNVKPVGTKAP